MVLLGCFQKQRRRILFAQIHPSCAHHLSTLKTNTPTICFQNDGAEPRINIPFASCKELRVFAFVVNTTVSVRIAGQRASTFQPNSHGFRQMRKSIIKDSNIQQCRQTISKLIPKRLTLQHHCSSSYCSNKGTSLGLKTHLCRAPPGIGKA